MKKKTWIRKVQVVTKEESLSTPSCIMAVATGSTTYHLPSANQGVAWSKRLRSVAMQGIIESRCLSLNHDGGNETFTIGVR